MKKLPLLTKSAEETYRACPRLYKHRYVDCIEPVRRHEAAAFGTLVHKGLEAWWKAHMGGDDCLLAAYHAISANAGEADEWEVIRAEELLRGYDARWSSEDLAVLAVEVEFEVPLVNPETGAASKSYRYGGKIDAVVALPNGEVAIVEHKTTTEDVTSGSPYWQRLRLDPQVSGYFVGARSLGFDVRTCIYDVLSRPMLRPLKATPEELRKFTKKGTLYQGQRDADETRDEYRARVREHIANNAAGYFARGVVSRLEEDELDAAHDRWQHAIAIREATRTGRFPRNPSACTRYGRTCAFLEVCCREASLDDTTRFRRLETAHPELSLT